MSAQICTSPAPPFRPQRQPAQAALAPSSANIGAPGQSSENANKPQHAERPNGWLRNLWAAYCKRRAEFQLRNLAADMDPHILQDVGAPHWLINETTMQRDLARLRHTDYMRW
ncbi:hypothetical protein [Achromobacter marplatensis]|uniref:hypothetical protein n=1 Tax=Achromobacter marplatensis TaxID=470868 RepID=UPI0039F65ACC